MGDGRTANDIDKKLGERVRARRLEIGMSQETLADELGVTFQQVQKYERGVNRIAASRLVEISGALEAPIPYFFHGIGRWRGGVAHDGEETTAALATPGAADLVKMYASIKSAKLRRRLLELVRAMEEGD